MRKFMIGAAALAMLVGAGPALAQQSSVKPGAMWMANQDYARSQGWMLDYHILQSLNPRDREPNIILITRFKDMPSAAEADRRTEILNKRLSQDAHSADAASGARNTMRKLMGSVLYREVVKR